MKQIKWVGLGFLLALACSEPLVRLGQEAAAGSGGDDAEPDQPILTGGAAGGTNGGSGGSGGTSGVAVGGTGGTAGESLGGAGDSPPPPMGGSTGQPACEAPTTRAATCVLGPTGELIENSFSAEARITSIEDATTDECGSGIFRPTLPATRIFLESNDDRQWTVVVAVSDWPSELTAQADATFRLEAAPNTLAFFKTVDQTWALRTAAGFTAIGSHKQQVRAATPPDFTAEGITLTDAEQDCDLGDTGPNCRRHWRTMQVQVGADSALLKHGQAGQIGPLWLGLQTFERHVDGGACDDKASVDLVGFMP
jgi:hypothetical protein